MRHVNLYYARIVSSAPENLEPTSSCFAASEMQASASSCRTFSGGSVWRGVDKSASSTHKAKAGNFMVFKLAYDVSVAPCSNHDSAMPHRSWPATMRPSAPWLPSCQPAHLGTGHEAVQE